MRNTEPVYNSTSRSILAVLVLYKLKPFDSITLTSFCSALTESGLTSRFTLMIYDNSPVQSDVPGDISVSFTYHHNPANGGLYAAYNEALKQAEKNGYEWLLLLDQDTALHADYLKALYMSLGEAAKYSKCAALVPKLLSGNRIISPALVLTWGRMTPVDADQHGIFAPEVTALNSGALIRVAAIQRIGGFNPLFWLDYMDHWMFNRLHHAGYTVHILNVALSHDLSVERMKRMSVERYKNILSAESDFYRYCKSPAENRAYPFRLLMRAIKRALIPGARRLCLPIFAQLIRRSSD